jgi:hypothetical protein
MLTVDGVWGRRSGSDRVINFKIVHRSVRYSARKVQTGFGCITVMLPSPSLDLMTWRDQWNGSSPGVPANQSVSDATAKMH